MNIKKVERTIGIENMKYFFEFMRGQTVGINRNGEIDYYDCDVERFNERSNKWRF